MERRRSVSDQKRVHPVPFGRDTGGRQAQTAERLVPTVRPRDSVWPGRLVAERPAGPSVPAIRYKELVHEEVEHHPPNDTVADMAKLEEEIQRGMKKLEGMLE
jgi:hypothetical protein